MVDKTKNAQKLIWFDKPLAKRIAKAAKQADTDAAKWIRQACREKLERDLAARQTAGERELQRERAEEKAQ